MRPFDKLPGGKCTCQIYYVLCTQVIPNDKVYRWNRQAIFCVRLVLQEKDLPNSSHASKAECSGVSFPAVRSHLASSSAEVTSIAPRHSTKARYVVILAGTFDLS